MTVVSQDSARRSGTGLPARDLALVALAVFVFSIPYENGVTIPAVGSLARIIGFLAIGVVVLTLVERGRVRLQPPSVFLVAVAIYALWALGSYFWSIAPNATMTRGVTLVQLGVMVWMVHQIGSTERRRDALAQAFVFGAYAMIAVALFTFLSGTQSGLRDVGGINPNWFAIGCAFAVPFAWGLVLRARHSLLFWINALYPAFAVIAVVLSASRGGLITLLVALTVIPLSLPRLGTTRRLLVFGLVAGISVGTFVAAPQVWTGLHTNLERLESTVDEIGGGGTLTGRTLIWEAGLDAFLASPIVGHGHATFGAAIEPIFGQGRSAHNAYLSVAVGSGLIGLGLFVGTILVVVAGILATPERRLEFLVIVATLLVGMMPANLEHTKSVWFVLGWLAAARPFTLVAAGVADRPEMVPAPRTRPAAFTHRTVGPTSGDSEPGGDELIEPRQV